MPSSKQTPLTSPRGRDPHDFSQTQRDWEAAVFDSAIHFAVVELGMGDRTEHSYDTFTTLPEAIAYARDRQRVTLNAVTASGRFALLDQEKWPEWLQRWSER